MPQDTNEAQREALKIYVPPTSAEVLSVATLTPTGCHVPAYPKPWFLAPEIARKKATVTDIQEVLLMKVPLTYYADSCNLHLKAASCITASIKQKPHS